MRATAVATPVPVKIAAMQFGARALAVDATHLYWVNRLGAALMRVGKAAGMTPVMVSAATVPTSLALDDLFVYWLDLDGVHRLTKSGGTAALIVKPSTFPTYYGTAPMTAIAVDAAFLYVGVSDDLIGGVYRTAKDGSTTPTLLTKGVGLSTELLAVDEWAFAWNYALPTLPQPSFGLWPKSGSNGYGAAAPNIPKPFTLRTPSAFFFAQTNDYSASTLGLHSVSECGGKARTLRPFTSTEKQANCVAADSSYVYWSDGSSIRRAPY